MFLITLMCLFSFACLLVSLIVLGLVLISSNYNRAQVQTSTSDLVVLTGCDSGIGLELAKHIHANTKYTLMCGFLDLAASNEGYQQLQRLSQSDQDGRLVLCKFNITSDDDVNSVKDSIEEMKSSKKIQRVVALINNAGVMTYGEFDWLTWDHVQSQVDVNLLGTLRLTKLFVPYIIQSKGRIINISSVNDATVFPGLSVYSATKSALSTFSLGLGYELRKFGAHVITLRLGDFSRLTNILRSHATYRAEMWKGMDWKKRDLYEGYFDQFHDHLMENYGMTSPRKFVDSNLFNDLNLALLAKKPPHTITCTPLAFRIFYFVIELMPIYLQYLLLDVMLHVAFKWKSSSEIPPASNGETKASVKVEVPVDDGLAGLNNFASGCTTT